MDTIPASQEEVRELTVFVHGVMSNGKGLWPLVDDCRNDDSFPFKRHRLKVYNHGFVFPWEPWTWGNRKKLRDSIGGYLHKQKRKYPFLEQVNVLAHSYGSYGICDYLRNCEYNEFSVDNLILLGSVVPRDYDWNHIINNKDMVSEVANLVSKYDVVPSLGPLVNLGTSGDYLAHKLTGQDYGFTTDVENVDNILVTGGHLWYRSEDGKIFLRQAMYDFCKHVDSPAITDV